MEGKKDFTLILIELHHDETEPIPSGLSKVKDTPVIWSYLTPKTKTKTSIDEPLSPVLYWDEKMLQDLYCPDSDFEEFDQNTQAIIGDFLGRQDTTLLFICTTQLFLKRIESMIGNIEVTDHRDFKYLILRSKTKTSDLYHVIPPSNENRRPNFIKGLKKSAILLQ